MQKDINDLTLKQTQRFIPFCLEYAYLTNAKRVVKSAKRFSIFLLYQKLTLITLLTLTHTQTNTHTVSFGLMQGQTSTAFNSSVYQITYVNTSASFMYFRVPISIMSSLCFSNLMQVLTYNGIKF